MPEISVVIPVYNAEKYIAETLESVLTQSFEDFEVHVVDDCSTDASPAIVKEFVNRDARIHYHRSPSNFGGPAGPRNLGIAMSNSTYIAFCDADDVWVPYKLEIQMSVMASTNASIVSSSVRDFQDGEQVPLFLKPQLPVETTVISHAKLKLKNWVALSSVMVRRSAFTETGQFNSDREYVAVEDYDMWVRMTQLGFTIRRVSAPLVHYRKLSHQLSSNKMMMIRKALNVIGDDYRRKKQGWLFTILRPAHWFLYVGTSAWMRIVKKEL